MIEITLPDKSKRNFEEPPSIYELAQDIGPGLAKATLAGIIDGVEPVSYTHLRAHET